MMQRVLFMLRHAPTYLSPVTALRIGDWPMAYYQSLSYATMACMLLFPRWGPGIEREPFPRTTRGDLQQSLCIQLALKTPVPGASHHVRKLEQLACMQSAPLAPYLHPSSLAYLQSFALPRWMARGAWARFPTAMRLGIPALHIVSLLAHHSGLYWGIPNTTLVVGWQGSRDGLAFHSFWCILAATCWVGGGCWAVQVCMGTTAGVCGGVTCKLCLRRTLLSFAEPL